MFTGIIQHTSVITNISTQADIVSVSLTIPENWSIELGESISINGVCSTVARKGDTEFTVEYMPETLRKTTVSQWGIGGVYNLEKSLRVGDGLDGHFVMGHIDTVGTITNITPEGDSQVFEIALPPEFLHYIAYKWSVSLDGISLTVSAVTENSFSVSLIPYTLIHTNLHERKVGDSLNIETDILAKYLLK
jgi:riboflavin synthase